MNWYYVQGSEQKGPVTEAELAQLVANGTVTASTLVWREGMDQWAPWSTVQAGQSDPPPVNAPAAGTCAVCRQAFAPDDLVEVGGRPVCAACKPTLLQQLREGSTAWNSAAGFQSSAGTSHGSLTDEDIIARDYDLPVTQMFDQARRMMFEEASTLLLAGALVTLVLMACGFVPYLGAIAGMILQGPINGGFQIMLLRRIRGANVTVGDAFCGFGPRFWKLSGAYFFPVFLTGLVFIPMVAAFALLFFGLGVTSTGASGVGVPFLLAAIGIGLVSILVAIRFSIGWFWTLCLVADRHYPVGEAMKLSRKVVSRHFWLHIWLLVFSGIVGFIGLLLCGIGIFVATPIIALATTLLYEHVFNGLASRE